MITVPILFTFDETLLMPAGVAITSLMENAGADTFYDIFVLHGPGCHFQDTPLADIPRRYSNCRIRFRSVGHEFEGAYRIRGIPETAYYRLLAPELIPEYDKILYSDVDVVFREDLRPYYETELSDNYFAGVDNGVRLRKDMQDYVRGKLGLDPNKGYFYSGNLVINADLQRKDRMTDRFRELARKNFYDQDMAIINLSCNGRILSLGPSFCLTNNLYNLIVQERKKMSDIYGEEELSHALSSGIIHYNGAKPWKKACMNMDLWWHYYRKSCFYDEQFCRDFWDREAYLLDRLSLVKRLKLLLRYPLDRMNKA